MDGVQSDHLSHMQYSAVMETLCLQETEGGMKFTCTIIVYGKLIRIIRTSIDLNERYSIINE